MFVARKDRPLGACAQDFHASQGNSRPGGGAESVGRSRSPGGAGRSVAVGGLEVSVSCSIEYTEL